MDIKKLFLTSAIALGALTVNAQGVGETVEYDFQPHFYVQVQPLGAQETVGEGSFGDLLSYNVQAAFGYQWNPLFGARLAINGWQSRAAMNDYRWHYSYIAPMVDLTFDLTNAFGGYNPTRCWSLNLIAGIGGNDHFRNQRANKLNGEGGALEGKLKNIWNHGKWTLAGRVGAGVDVRITDQWAFSGELTLNATSDKYNSKVGSNSDFYFNLNLGVKYTFGQSYSKRIVPVVAPVQEIIRETVYRDTVIVKEAPVVVNEAFNTIVSEATAFERNVFFKINQSVIRPQEMVKVEEIANYMNAHPGSRVHITGYADKGTGTLAINLRLARERANAVVNALIKKYGINGDRITSSSMTDTLFQPFDTPEENRVAICVVE